MEQVTLEEQTILKIAKYKCQLAELDRQFWFENLDLRFYRVNFDRLTEAIKELEND
tara:strand:+ start:165 stop:332 length:168 start_codon:yes stop_codon:yes gene_type:complete